MGKTLFVVDELYPVHSAPAVRIENLMRGLPHGTVAAVGGVTRREAMPSHYTALTRPSEHKPLAFAAFLLQLGRRAIREARASQPDTIVLSVPKYELLLFAPALRRCCRQFVLDVRDSLDFLDYGAYLAHYLPGAFARPAGGVVKRAIGQIEQRALRAADIVTVANEGIRRTISHRRTVVIPNGVDTNLFYPGSAERSHGDPRLRMVYVGNFAEKDLFGFVLESAARVPDAVEVHLVGEGRNKAHVLAAFQNRGVRWIDHGRVPHADLPALLRGMDLGFIFRGAAVRDSIPVSIFEFAASGIPACCNDTGMMADVVRAHRLGFVVSGAGELTDLMTAVRKDPTLLGGFRHLHQTAAEHFSLARTAERFAELVGGSV